MGKIELYDKLERKNERYARKMTEYNIGNKMKLYGV